MSTPNQHQPESTTQSQQPNSQADSTSKASASVPQAVALFRLMIMSAVVTLLVLVDAIWMQVTGYGADSTNNFGLTNAAVVFISGGILLLVTLGLAALWQNASKKGDK